MSNQEHTHLALGGIVREASMGPDGVREITDFEVHEASLVSAEQAKMSNLYTLQELHQIVSQLAMITIGNDESLYGRVELIKEGQDAFEILAVRARDMDIVDTMTFQLVPIEEESKENA